MCCMLSQINGRTSIKIAEAPDIGFRAVRMSCMAIKSPVSHRIEKSFLSTSATYDSKNRLCTPKMVKMMPP